MRHDHDPAQLAPGASDTELAALETVLGLALPASLRTLLREANGRYVDPVVNLHSTTDIIDLDGCYPIREPGFLAIGDNSGGSALVIPQQGEPSPVFLLDHGWMSVEGKQPIADDLVAWVRAGCPIPSDVDADAHALVEVFLDGLGSAARLPLIALLRQTLGLDLRTARERVDHAPSVLVVREAFLARYLVDELAAIGAAVSTRPADG